MRAPAEVGGEVASGFEPVRDAVARVLDAQGGGGVAVAAVVGGRPVVDVWAGDVGPEGLVHTWSAVKPLVGACALILVERGRLRLTDPVARHWPELRAAAGGMQVGHVLCHAAGLARAPDGGAAALLDWEATCAGLAAAEPDWEPGTAVGEHAMTYGHLVGELVRRVDGRGIGRFLAEELAAPLALDVHVGVDARDLARVVDLQGVTRTWWDELRGPPGSLRHRALPAGVDAALVNGAAWRQGEVPAVNGHATARGLAGFYAAWLAGRLPRAAGDVGAEGADLVLGTPAAWTWSGGRAEDGVFGMGGVGGQWAGAHPSLDLAWAFLTSVMGGYERVDAVERALLACL